MLSRIFNSALFILIFCETYSQKLTIYNGLNTNLTDQKIKMIDSKEDLSNNGGFLEIEYEQYLGRKFSVSGSYFRYEGNTLIRFKKGSVKTQGVDIDAIGFSGIYFDRYNFLTRYKIGNKFCTQLGFGLSYQKSFDKGFEVASLSEINGPDYFRIDERALSYTKAQIIPIADIRFSYTFYKLLSLNLRVAGALGFSSHQDLYFEYQYKGVQQPTALFQARGTGLFFTAGVSINFKTLYKILQKM